MQPTSSNRPTAGRMHGMPTIVLESRPSVIARRVGDTPRAFETQRAGEHADAPFTADRCAAQETPARR